MKCVVLLAGKGERLRPLTNTRPKALLPVANSCLIDHILEATAGFTEEYVFVVNHLEDMIREYISKAHPSLNVTYVVQEKINGTGGALLCASDIMDDFLCVNGDIFVERDCIEKAIELNKRTGNQVISVKLMDNDGRYGSILLNNDRLIGIDEKKAGNTQSLVNIGVYVFSPEIFKSLQSTGLSERGEYELTDAIVTLAHTFSINTYGGYWNDIGYPWSLLEANEHVLSNQINDVNGIIEPNVSISGDVQIGKGTRIRSGAYIVGPVRIGCNCDIGPNCFIRPFTSIGDKCHVGNATEIKNSILFDNTNAAHLSYVGDSIIGENCNLGAGTLIANLRHKKDPVKMEIKGQVISSGRRKLGAVIGDNTKTGINVSIYEGRKIGNDCGIGPGVIVDKNVDPNTLVIIKQSPSYIGKD